MPDLDPTAGLYSDLGQLLDLAKKRRTKEQEDALVRLRRFRHDLASQTIETAA